MKKKRRLEMKYLREIGQEVCRRPSKKALQEWHRAHGEWERLSAQERFLIPEPEKPRGKRR